MSSLVIRQGIPPASPDSGLQTTLHRSGLRDFADLPNERRLLHHRRSCASLGHRATPFHPATAYV